jgi:hypothetical protein
MTESAWHLGLVNADGSGFRRVKNAELKPDAFGAPEWARDGKSIFCHDLDNIYQIDLDGKVLKKWELAKILTDASMNGAIDSAFPPTARRCSSMLIVARSMSAKTGMVHSPPLND